MKNMSLGKYWHIRMTVFVFFCVIVGQLILVLSFISYDRINTANRQELYINALRDAAYHDVQLSADFINDELLKIADMAYLLKMDHENFFSYIDEFEMSEDRSGYIHNDMGMLKSVFDYNASSLLYPLGNIDSERDYIKAYTSERMNAVFKQIKESSIYIESIYFISNDGMTRMYPYSTYTDELLGGDSYKDIFQYYEKMYREKNLAGNHVWNDSYMDPAENDGIVSCYVPIYCDGILEGVSGIDVDISKLLDRVITTNISVESAAIIVNEAMDVVAENRSATNLFTRDQSELTIENDSLQINPSKKNGIVKKLNNLFIQTSDEQLPFDKEDIDSYLIVDTDYFLSKIEIPETEWTYYSLIRNEDLMAPLKKLDEDMDKAYKSLTFLMIGVNLFLLLLVYYAQGKLSRKLAFPIVQLSNDVKNFEIEAGSSLEENPTGINELDDLKLAFNELVNHIDDRAARIVKMEKEKQLQEAQIEILDEYSYIDALTGIHNRRKLDQILDIELYRSMRYNKPLTTILIDIDHFKVINDAYGHIIGDTVLKTFVSEIKDNIRKSDYLCRWGGEEFQIVCPETSKEGAMILSEKLRGIIEAKNFNNGIKVTASFGVAEFNPDVDDKFIIFKRVDRAMYKAKDKGRNRVEFG